MSSKHYDNYKRASSAGNRGGELHALASNPAHSHWTRMAGTRPTQDRSERSDRSLVSDLEEDEKASHRAPLSPLTWLCDFQRDKPKPAPMRTVAGTGGQSRAADAKEPRDRRTSRTPHSSSNQQRKGDNGQLYSDFMYGHMQAGRSSGGGGVGMGGGGGGREGGEDYGEDYGDDLGLRGPHSFPSVDSSGHGKLLPPTSNTTKLSGDMRTMRSNSLVAPIPLSSMSLFSTPEQTTAMVRPLQGEARIVAPNVSKLSPQSAVEIRLQSQSEFVAVLCSVDVLKMRSTFFHDLLLEQEKSSEMDLAPPSHPAPLAPYASGGQRLWRQPIVISEALPFEAAAFLESLHEGRVLFRGEWNQCWARLSVTWVVEDLVAEFASQIEAHMGKVSSIIQQNHWRTNPALLAGMRAAIFRKGSTLSPTILTGIVVEANPSPGYSKARIAFDSESAAFRLAPNISNIISAAPPPAPRNLRMGRPSPQLSVQPVLPASLPDPHDLPDPPSSALAIRADTIGSVPSSSGMEGNGGGVASNGNSTNPSTAHGNVAFENAQPQMMGDIGEPFWVQANKDGAVWCDPDEISSVEVRKAVSATDRRVFWEMVRSLIDLPELSMACKSGIRSPADITTILKRAEYRVLWTAEAAEILTKDMAMELIRHAYVPQEK